MAQERNLNLDFVKIVAMVFVVGLHSGTSFYINDVDINQYYKYTICGTAVPLFFTVSGYLLLGRNNINWHYSAKKIWGIVRFVFVVCWIYWLIMLIITREPQWEMLYKDPLRAFLMGGTFWQFWYFGAMCLIYLIYPLVNHIYNENEKAFNTLFVCLMALCFIIYFLNIITPGTLEVKLQQSIRLWNWLMYFCLGGIIRSKSGIIRNNKYNWYLVILLAIAYCAQIAFVSHFNPPMIDSQFNFSSPITLMYIYLLFHALNSLNVQKINNGIIILSPLFLPVYTLHPFFIYNTQEFRHTFHAGYPIYWMIITVASIAVSWLIMQTKVGKWVFRI